MPRLVACLAALAVSFAAPALAGSGQAVRLVSEGPYQPAGAQQLTVHSERHAYAHLTEDGVDRRFIQEQVGHECDSSTAVYTNSRELHQTGAFAQVA